MNKLYISNKYLIDFPLFRYIKLSAIFFYHNSHYSHRVVIQLSWTLSYIIISCDSIFLINKYKILYRFIEKHYKLDSCILNSNVLNEIHNIVIV